MTTNTNPQQPDPITRREAAKMIKCHLNTVDRYLKNGTLTAYRDGFGRVWVDRKEVQRLITPVPVVVSSNR